MSAETVESVLEMSQIKADWLVICPHRDDEIFCFPILNEIRRRGIRAQFVFLTGNRDKKKSHRRNLESLSVLSHFGVDRKQVEFLGDQLEIYEFGDVLHEPDNSLAGKMSLVRGPLEVWVSKHPLVLVPCLEGGHPDHDTANVLLSDIISKAAHGPLGFGYPSYRGSRWKGFSVWTHPPVKRGGLRVRWSWRDAWLPVWAFFKYPTEWSAWFFLAPEMTFRILASSESVWPRLTSAREWDLNETDLFYEQRKWIKFDRLRKYWSRAMKTEDSGD